MRRSKEEKLIDMLNDPRPRRPLGDVLFEQFLILVISIILMLLAWGAIVVWYQIMVVLGIY